MELRIGNVCVRMDFGFPAMLALLLLFTDGQMLLCMAGVCLIHECGHGIAMLLTGAGIKEIHFYAAGMLLRTKSLLLPRGAEWIVHLSGPAANLLAAAFCYTLHIHSLGFMHLAVGIFNLLPFRVLDGGSALRSLFAEYPAVLRWIRYGCLVFSLGVILFSLYMDLHNPAFYPMFCYLLITELQVDKKGGLW